MSDELRSWQLEVRKNSLLSALCYLHLLDRYGNPDFYD
jgi:hypothetical protein